MVYKDQNFNNSFFGDLAFLSGIVATGQDQDMVKRDSGYLFYLVLYFGQTFNHLLYIPK
jgi:hypothetical protein